MLSAQAVLYHRIQHILELFLGMQSSAPTFRVMCDILRLHFDENSLRYFYSSGEEENSMGDGMVPPMHTCIKSSADYELSLILKEIRYITDQVNRLCNN